MTVLNGKHLRRLLMEYFANYHESRIGQDRNVGVLSALPCLADCIIGIIEKLFRLILDLTQPSIVDWSIRSDRLLGNSLYL